MGLFFGEFIFAQIIVGIEGRVINQYQQNQIRLFVELVRGDGNTRECEAARDIPATEMANTARREIMSDSGKSRDRDEGVVRI